jgi:hypothetical protein
MSFMQDYYDEAYEYINSYDDGKGEYPTAKMFDEHFKAIGKRLRKEMVALSKIVEKDGILSIAKEEDGEEEA